jgi:hypothetical protein
MNMKAVAVFVGIALGMLTLAASQQKQWTPDCWHGRTVDSGFHPCEDPQTDRVEDRR